MDPFKSLGSWFRFGDANANNVNNVHGEEGIEQIPRGPDERGQRIPDENSFDLEEDDEVMPAAQHVDDERDNVVDDTEFERDENEEEEILEEPLNQRPAQPEQAQRTGPVNRARAPDQTPQNAPKRRRTEGNEQNANLPSTSEPKELRKSIRVVTYPEKFIKSVKTEFAKEDEEELVIDVDNRPTCMAISSDIAPTPRIKMIRDFVARIPKGCAEAIRGQKYGSLKLLRNGGYPGIPFKKFSAEDEPMYGKGQTYWSVQSILKSSQKDKFWVNYVGWASTTMMLKDSAEMLQTAPGMMKQLQVKNNFWKQLQAIYKKTGLFDGCKDGFAREEFLQEKIMKDPTHLYWLYQDMSYFHSKIHENHGLGPIQYVCPTNELALPPTFTYTPCNVMRNDVYKIQLLLSKECDDELENVYISTPSARPQTACETPHTCKCRATFIAALKKTGATYIQHDENGFLRLNASIQGKDRIVVECTDECGCSASCPRRPLQQVQENSFFVTRDGQMEQSVLRAGNEYKKGQFVIEYTGDTLEEAPGTKSFDRDGSYDAECKVLGRNTVISSWKVGNASRFMSHSCSPNAILIETYSRKCRNDPLLPRVAVYALVDIKIGEQITISYWPQSEMKNTGGIKCLCSPTCQRYLNTA